MSKVKEFYWDSITEDANDYEVFQALHYHSTLWAFIELMKQYGTNTVLGDVFKLIESKEIK